MSKRTDLLTHFRTLPPHLIRKLTAAQKDDLLAAFHTHLNEAITERPQKHKQISKMRNSISYKGYIRRNSRNIINRLTARMRQHPIDNWKGGREGKSKFKWGSAEWQRRRMDNFERRFRQAVSEGSREDLNCSICLETLIRPVLTVCGHAFCFQCLDQSLLFSSNCPNCRESIKGVELIGCAVLDRLVRRAAASPGRSAWQIAYGERLKRFTEWRRGREVEIGQLKAGVGVDVRDTENIWCEGTIVEVQWGCEGPIAVLVHFNRWHNIYNEIIELPSLRLAPLRFFSSRTDIPRYNLSLPDNNMRGLVISGAPDPPNLIEVDDSSSEEEQLNAEGVELAQQPQLAQPPMDLQNMQGAIADFLTHFNFSRIMRVPNPVFHDHHMQEGDSQSDMEDELLEE